MIEFTDWAKDILARSQAAARRFNPDAKIRLAKVGGAKKEVLHPVEPAAASEDGPPARPCAPPSAGPT